jgi:hypothetical protein
MLSAAALGRPLRAADTALFLTLFVCYAWFHQGGGWNQNSRFSQVRAIVETGSLSINAFWRWTAVFEGGVPVGLQRRPLAMPSVQRSLAQETNGFDVAMHDGRVFPNKPPGTTLLALPAGWLSWQIERRLGLDLDAWWPLTLRLYAITVLSVGLIGAAGGVVFRRASNALFPEVPPPWHVAAALTFGLGTLIWPYATILMDHVPHAVLLLTAFALVHSAVAEGGHAGPWRLAAAGLAGGLAALVNYSAVLALAPLALYGAIRLRSVLALAPALLGAIPPLLLLGAYHDACFGRIVTLVNSFQPETFRSKDAVVMGVFKWPDPAVLVRLLVSEYRGLFLYAPALLVGLLGLFRMVCSRRLRLEGALFASVFLAFLLMNASFNGWHGGSAYGPRYLVPAVPFLALPLAPLLQRRPRTVGAIALLSAAIALLGTAVTVQVHATLQRPLTKFLVPVVSGQLLALGGTPVEGPVSIEPQGVYEARPHRLFPPRSTESRWNSFNVGEFLFPNRPVSLAPLLLWLGAAVPISVRLAGRKPDIPGESSAGQ